MAKKIFVVHFNGTNPCIDGLMSAIVAGISIAPLKGKDKVYFSTPAPEVVGGKLQMSIRKGEEFEKVSVIPQEEIEQGTEITFLDCHPTAGSVSKAGAMQLKCADGETHEIKIQILDHHISHVPIIQKTTTQEGKSLVSDMTTQEVVPILPKIAGCHLAVKKLLLDEIFPKEEYQSDDKGFADLHNRYNQESITDKYVKSLEYLKELAPIIQKESAKKLQRFKEFITVDLANQLLLAANIDLFSLGSIEAKEALSTIELDSASSLAEIRESLDQATKEKYGINDGTISMNLFDQRAKSIWEQHIKQTKEGQRHLDSGRLSKMLDGLNTAKVSQGVINTIKQKYKLLDKIDTSYIKLDERNVLEELEELKDKTVLVFPFSVSTGFNNDLLEKFNLPKDDKKIVNEGAPGGLIREAEAALIEIMKKEKEDGKEVLCVLIGNSVSLRSTQEMIMWNGTEVVNLLKGMGFNKCAGHPSACGGPSPGGRDGDTQINKIIQVAKKQLSESKKLYQQRS